MAKTLCVGCREVFDTEDATEDQKRIAEGLICPGCWKEAY